MGEGSVPAPLPRLALVMGAEGDGVSDEILALASRAVFLPMSGFMQSLNVAVACGMLLQRLFDLCPEARGDLEPKDRAALKVQLLQAVPRLGTAADLDRDEAGVTEGDAADT